MMHCVQLVHTLNYGDAISGEALVISRLLTELGIENSLLSLHAHEKVKEYRHPWTRFEGICADARSRGKQVSLLLHYSIGSPQNAAFCAAEGMKRAIVYHNLTPDHWFTGYNARVTQDLRRGREELPALLEKADIVIADSEFNKRELAEVGCERAQVLPLPLDTKKWAIAENAGIAHALRAHGGTNILHVGRTAPNKCVEDILKSFYFYHHKINRLSRLWLVGSDIDTEIYGFELRRLISELRLKDAVALVGAVSDGELKAFYQHSDVYLCMSEHEGFCVPLLEAMHFGLPIVAYSSSAVAETLGDAGILVQEKNHGVIAELLQILCSDQSLREDFRARGRRRVEAYSLEAFAQRFRQTVLEPLGQVSVTGTGSEHIGRL